VRSTFLTDPSLAELQGLDRFNAGQTIVGENASAALKAWANISFNGQKDSSGHTIVSVVSEDSICAQESSCHAGTTSMAGATLVITYRLRPRLKVSGENSWCRKASTINSGK
jgi:uncharacterized protein (DUF2147 family)